MPVRDLDSRVLTAVELREGYPARNHQLPSSEKLGAILGNSGQALATALYKSSRLTLVATRFSEVLPMKVSVKVTVNIDMAKVVSAILIFILLIV